MWYRAELKTRAKTVLKSSYWKAFLVSLIIAVVGGNSSGSPNFNWNFGGGKSHNLSNSIGNINGSMLPIIVGGIIIAAIIVCMLVFAFRVFLGYPLEVGGRRYFVRAAQNEVNMNHIGFAFEKGKYIDIIKAMLWRALFNFLWFLLFFIPGIVKAYAYSMVPYILADNPNIGYKRALQLSKQMTSGQKFKLFVLDLSFLGWLILGALALLVGVLFVMPYVNATKAELYIVLRQNALENSLCSYNELLQDLVPQE